MIRITIEAERGGGKTTCAIALHQALTKLGAQVTVNDEALTSRATGNRALAIAEGVRVLEGRKVQIDTFLPAGTQG